MLALAAMLLVAALAAAPARAQDAAVVVPAPEAAAPDPATTDSSPAPTVPTDPGPPAAPAESPATDASPDPVVTDDPGAGDTVVEAPQSTPDADRTPTRQPSHNADGGGGQTASAAPTVPTTGEDTTVDTVAPSSDGYPGAWSGQDTFVVDKAKGPDTGAAGAFGGPRGPFSGLIAFRAASRASGVVATARRSHSVAQVSPLGGPPGSGHQPGHNLFFNLLSGPGGSAAGLALASILAILGVAFVLPRDRLRTFRMPAVSWRPLAYVPPIELPG